MNHNTKIILGAGLGLTVIALLIYNKRVKANTPIQSGGTLLPGRNQELQQRITRICTSSDWKDYRDRFLTGTLEGNRGKVWHDVNDIAFMGSPLHDSTPVGKETDYDYPDLPNNATGDTSGGGSGFWSDLGNFFGGVFSGASSSNNSDSENEGRLIKY